MMQADREKGKRDTEGKEKRALNKCNLICKQNKNNNKGIKYYRKILEKILETTASKRKENGKCKK